MLRPSVRIGPLDQDFAWAEKEVPVG